MYREILFKIEQSCLDRIFISVKFVKMIVNTKKNKLN